LARSQQDWHLFLDSTMKRSLSDSEILRKSRLHSGHNGVYEYGSLHRFRFDDKSHVVCYKIEHRFYFMTADNSSKTAEYMALFRALESKRSSRTRLFSDPLATDFLRPSLKRVAFLAHFPGGRTLVEKIADRRIPGARTSAIARTRLIDDLLTEGTGNETCQLVILGAGFDCRAYRLPILNGRELYEVDQPLTLERKRTQLKERFGKLLQNHHYVPIDFNRESLLSTLQQAGLKNSVKTVFLWEGVTNYLTAEAVDSVLRYVSGFPLGSRLIFTYVHSGVLDATVKFYGAERLLADVAELHEPWIFGMNPDEVGNYLQERGLRLVVDLGGSEYRKRYFGSVADDMRGYEFYHVAMAEVLHHD
jgi:methyltransferase (TIGR00027 family)